MERRQRETKTELLLKNLSLLVRQFFLLLGKNFLLQIRRPIGTVFELVIPISAILVLVAFRFGIPSLGSTDHCYQTFGSDPITIPTLSPRTIYYAPNNTDNVRQFKDVLASKLAQRNILLVGVATEEEFVLLIANSSETDQFCDSGVGIYFNNLDSSDIQYTLRMNPDLDWLTDTIEPVFELHGARSSSPYFEAGFMHLEKVVDEAIIEWKTGTPFSIDVNMRQFPFPDYKRNYFLFLLQLLLPLFLVLSLVYSVGVFVKELVLEKESRMKETMKMMGLSNWTLVSTWFTKQILFYITPIVVMALLLKFAKVYPRSDFFLLLTVLLFYYMTSVAFSFFISVWFSSARLASFAGFFLWFLLFFPYFFLQLRYSSLTFFFILTVSAVKMVTSLISNMCIGYTVQILTVLEVQGDGLQFSNIATPLSTEDHISIGWMLLMMFLDTVLYMSLYWYIDAVKPGKYGSPKPFYFLFLPSFWCGNIARKKVKSEGIDGCTNPVYDITAHEPEPADSEVGITIDRLTKIFNRLQCSNKKVAVDNLTLNMYKGQITALLGHNGAGKTTTMAILTGLLTSTSGSAYINGYCVQTEIDQIRRSLGICPQHNLLFDRLTVYEHLVFFCMLKGMATNKVKTEVNQMIIDLQVADKRNRLAKKLSGGMKRKLSVGIALVGQSEVVILDEPTSGMDPYARRATWDLLLKHKEGRTMLLTTHFMDEADLLGDRIAIMTEGRLKCSGSSLFLKSRFGIGYHMTVVKETGCDSRKIIDIVKGMVTGSSELTDVGAELSFRLPSDSRNQFPDMFDTLEKEKVELGISSFGVSNTTMEEVFIKVGQEEEDNLQSSHIKLIRSDQSTATDRRISINTALEDGDVGTTQGDSPELMRAANSGEESLLLLQQDPGVDIEMRPVCSNDQYRTSYESPSYKRNTGLVLWLQQIYAIFIKNFYHAIRFWTSIIWQFIIPLTSVVLSLVLIITQPGNNNSNPSRVLSLHNTAPAKSIDFFWANLGDVSSPFTLEANDASSLGISSVHNFTQDIDNLKQQISNHSTIDQCCDYRYQILDKFCASRTVGEYYRQCKDNAAFSLRACTNCLSCSTYHLSPSLTCTNPKQVSKNNRCPISPPISYADIQNGDLRGPLDDYDTFVAEKLLKASGDYLNPNSFFRRYHGGVVIHPETYTYSTCACINTDSEICSTLSPALLYNYPSDDETAFTEISAKYYDYGTLCSRLFDTSNPNCSSSNWNYEYNWAVGACISGQSTSCSDCYNPSNCTQYVGSVAETFSTSGRSKITLWYNNQPYHMAPAVLNSFYNLYLKQTHSDNSISVINKPLPKTADQQIDDSINGIFGYLVSYVAVLGMCFLFSSFIIFLIQQKESKAKHLQFVSGVGTTSYWIGTFLFDILNVLIPTVLIVIIYTAFDVEGFRKENLGAIFILFFLSSWAAIPISYIFSFLFTNALIAFATSIMFHYFIFLVLHTSMLLISEDLQKILYYIFLLHPTFALGSGITAMYDNQLLKDACTKTPDFERICKENGYIYLDTIFSFERPGINYSLIYLLLEGVIFFILTLLLERQFLIPEMRRLIQYLYGRRKQYQYVVQQSDSSLEESQDDDVKTERNRVHEIEQYTDEEVVIIKDLQKVYRGIIPCCLPGKKAVNGINIAISTGECFGLLGVNGAGKTTTFNILTGDLSATSGSATIAGYDISTQLHEVQKRIGYCPQFDAIIDLLTGRELLTMFARLRGIPEKHIMDVVQFEIDRLDLAKHANKRCGTYSGGNKRKLSTAIALIGNPPILFLDEPTTGMDPVTRRFLWDALINIVNEGRSVMITSHSMEECEALCSRLTIMVNGQFKCLGSAQYLKSKYGAGYTMELRVTHAQTIEEPDSQLTDAELQSFTSSSGTCTIKAFVAAEFPGSLLLEEHHESVIYRIPSEGTSYSDMFRKIEDNKEILGIINYSVSQTTLDQVFINFAKEQETSDGGGPGSDAADV